MLLKAFVKMLLGVMAGLAALAAPGQAADGRLRWNYQGGYFEQVNQSSWIELQPGYSRNYREVARSDQYVELVATDGSGIEFRLYANRCDWRTPRTSGQWEYRAPGSFAGPHAPTPVPPPPIQQPSPNGGGIRLDGFDQLLKVVELMNAERQKVGLPPLTIDPHLQTAAWNYAGFLARTDPGNKYSPDELPKVIHTLDGKDAWKRATEAGYSGHGVWENIANFQRDAQQVMYGPGWCWMNSPPHREAILNPVARHIGIAAWANDQGKLYWCAVFGQP